MDSVVDNPRVSDDLFRPIFEYLEDDEASLCAISLASSACRNEGQRILFRKVAPWSYTSHIRFLRTVAASPTRLALFVHRYNHSWGRNRPTVEALMNVLSNIVRDGLKSMSHLKELELGVFRDPDLDPCHPVYIQILSACTFRLERFKCRIYSRASGDLIERFLPHQTALRHLRLYFQLYPSRLRPLPLATCPQLVSVTASWDVIKALLPGNNILTIQIEGSNTPTDADIKSLAGELKCIKALAINLDYLLGMKHRLGLGAMQHFPSLIALKIYCHENEYGSLSFVTEFRRPEPLNMLSQLPVLQTLLLTGSGRMDADPDKEILALTRLIFDQVSERLRHIDIGSTYESYSRYFRSQDTVQDISDDEALGMWE